METELMEATRPLFEAVKHLMDLLEDGRIHMADTFWKNRSIKNSLYSMSKYDMFTSIDYGATMNLHAMYKGNCQENAHCADLVMIFQCNPRTVVVHLDNGTTISKFLRDTIAIHCFAETISKGKKTDAYGILRGLEEATLLIYKNLGLPSGAWYKDLHTIASDNCKNQNKCTKHSGTCLHFVRESPSDRLLCTYSIIILEKRWMAALALAISPDHHLPDHLKTSRSLQQNIH
jgi:hypothetical protein